MHHLTYASRCGDFDPFTFEWVNPCYVFFETGQIKKIATRETGTSWFTLFKDLDHQNQHIYYFQKMDQKVFASHLNLNRPKLTRVPGNHLFWLEAHLATSIHKVMNIKAGRTSWTRKLWLVHQIIVINDRLIYFQYNW